MKLRTLSTLLLVAISALAFSAAISAATFNPSADSYVDALNPTRNHGTSVAMRPDGSPKRNAYLRFNVSGASGSPTASLRFYAVKSHSVGLDLRTVANTSWGETTINFQNAPTLGPIVGSTGPLRAGNWYIIDVSPYVAGNGPVGFALTTTGSSAAKIATREALEAPELVVPAVPSASPFVVSRIGGTTYRLYRRQPARRLPAR